MLARVSKYFSVFFVPQKDTFHRLYSLYCQNKPQSEELRRQVGDTNPFFKECQRRLHHKLPLGAYLLKPVQRVTKYQLLLKVFINIFSLHGSHTHAHTC